MESPTTPESDSFFANFVKRIIRLMIKTYGFEIVEKNINKEDKTAKITFVTLTAKKIILEVKSDVVNINETNDNKLVTSISVINPKTGVFIGVKFEIDKEIDFLYIDHISKLEPVNDWLKINIPV